MTFARYVFFALLASLLTSCETFRPRSRHLTAQITHEGWIDCFEPNLNDGKTWCEASAILAQRERILLANDKDMPAPRSSVFSISKWLLNKSGPKQTRPVYSEHPLLRAAHKFEEFTSSPDQEWVFLTTAFDRARPFRSAAPRVNLQDALPHPDRSGTAPPYGSGGVRGYDGAPGRCARGMASV